MENQLVKIELPIELKDLAVKVSKEKQEEIQLVLNQIFEGTQNWKTQIESIEVKGINDKLSINLADTARKNVKQARLNAEKIFDAKREEVQILKSDFDLQDKLWLKGKQIMQIQFKAIEEMAEYKANFVKRYEAEQKELNVQIRISKVQIYAPELNRFEFENLSDAMFEIFLTGLKNSFEEKKALSEKIEAEKIAKLEAERIENERIRIENEKLKKDAEEKEKQAKIEHERIEKEREIERKKQSEILAKQEAEAKEKAKMEAEKHAKIQSELKAKAEAEKLEREKLEKELKAKAEAELKAQKEKERIEKERIELEKKAKNAPEKEKLIKFAELIERLQRPEIKTEEANKIMNDVNTLLSKVSNFIREKSANL
jgi:hypothetical protein